MAYHAIKSILFWIDDLFYCFIEKQADEFDKFVISIYKY